MSETEDWEVVCNPERRSEKRKSQKKEDAGAGKGRKVANHSVFSMRFVARVRSHLAR